MWQINTLLDGLSWPSISFVILIASLLLAAIVLWRRYRSRRLLMQRVAELEALSGAGRAIVASVLDVAALCELIAGESGKIIDNRTFQVGLFDENDYSILYWIVNGQKKETPVTFDLDDNRGLVGWVRDTKRPLLIGDFIKETDSLPAQPRYISDTPPRSAIFIPLISGDDCIGIIAAQSEQPYRFDIEDLRRLMILANQAAAAIAHAKLYERAQARATHLELVSNIARQVNAIQDWREIFEQVVNLTRNTFGFNLVSIYFLDIMQNDLILQTSSSELLKGRDIRLSVGRGIVGTAAATRQKIVSNNTDEDDLFLPEIPGQPDTIIDTKAELAIPLIVNEELLGVLDMQSSKSGVFRSAEIVALETLADEVAITIDKARKLAWQREQAWITTAQLQVAEAIDRNADLDDLIETITRLTAMLVGLSFCGILLWDVDFEEYRGIKMNHRDPECVSAFERLSLSIGDWGPLDAVHVGQEMLTTQIQAPWTPVSKAAARKKPIKMTLSPMNTKEQVLGVMVSSALEPVDDSSQSSNNVTNVQRQELLANIITLTARAIESAQLRIAQQEEAWVNTVLLQVAEAVNSLNNLNEILNTIIRLIPMLVGVKSAIVLFWDDERQEYRAGPSFGISEMGRGLVEAQAIDESELFAISSKPTDILNTSAVYYSLRLPSWLIKVMGTHNAHAFPLHARGRLVGALIVGSSPEDDRSFSPRQLNILNGIAHQAATAVVNDQLYKESAERNRLEQELDVARKIQASLIPSGSPKIPGCSVASYWQAARQVSGDFYDFLQLPSGNWSVLIADVADKGIPAALFMALSRTILRTVAMNREDPSEVLMRANQIINHDSQSDLFVTTFYGIWDHKNNTFTYANGGHNPPLLLRKDGKMQLLRSKGMALGVIPNIKVECKSIVFQSGDTLVLYTDGVTEAMNEDYDEFGLNRLRIASESANIMDASGVIESIRAAIDVHAGGTPQFDDITLVVMKRRERKG